MTAKVVFEGCGLAGLSVRVAKDLWNFSVETLIGGNMNSVPVSVHRQYSESGFAAIVF